MQPRAIAESEITQSELLPLVQIVLFEEKNVARQVLWICFLSPLGYRIDFRTWFDWFRSLLQLLLFCITSHHRSDAAAEHVNERRLPGTGTPRAGQRSRGNMSTAVCDLLAG